MRGGVFLHLLFFCDKNNYKIFIEIEKVIRSGLRMANVNSINLTITADGSQAISSMNRLGSETMNITEKIKKHWLGLSAAMIAAYATAMKAWSLAEKAAQFEEQKASLNSLAAQYNTTAAAIISSIQQASQGMISMSDAVDIAGESMMRNLSPLQIIKLAEAAETLSNISGQKVVDSFRNMTEAIALGRERALENAIGIIDLQAHYGDLINKMSDTEKQAARYAIVMEKVRDIQLQMGKSTLSVSDRMDQFKVTIDNWKNTAGILLIKIGAAFVNVFAAIGSAANWGIGTALNALGTLLNTIQKITNINLGGTALREIGQGFLEGSKYGEQLARQAHDIFENFGKIESVKIPSIIRKFGTEGAKPASDEIQKLNKQLQDMTDKITLSETAQIIKRAEEFKKAGADKILIEKWVTTERLRIQQKFNEEIDKQNESDYQKFLQALDEKFKAEEALQKQISELHKQETEFRMQMYEDSWQKMFDIANQIGGEAGQGVGQMMAGMKGIMDIETGQDPYSQRLDQLQTFIWDAYALHEQGAISELELNNFVNQQIAEMDNALMEQKLGIAQNTFGTMAGLMRTLSTLSKTEGDKAFKAYQAFAMAEAIISTAAGIARALKDYSWPLNIIVGAMVAAAGAVQISKIASARPGGGGGVSAPSAGGYNYTSPTEPSWRQAEEKPKSQVINVHYYHYGHVVDHDSFSREIVPSLKKAVLDGVE